MHSHGVLLAVFTVDHDHDHDHSGEEKPQSRGRGAKEMNPSSGNRQAALPILQWAACACASCISHLHLHQEPNSHNQFLQTQLALEDNRGTDGASGPSDIKRSALECNDITRRRPLRNVYIA